VTSALFDTSEQLGGTEHWRPARDGDAIGLELYLRHYSARAYADRRVRRLFVGPGEKLVLVAHDDAAVFVWRSFISMDDQVGICCAVFRNEGSVLSSTLIREADDVAFARWPRVGRHYTYVAPSKVRSSNPGYCFLMAGWRRAGVTKGGHGREQLHVLEVTRP
jgi:hypothetical protein